MPEPETLIPLPVEPSASPTSPVGETGGSSPSAVREAEAQLILRHTHLKEMLPRRQEAAAKLVEEVRSIRAEMVEIERILRVHKRIANPIRRKR